MFYNRRVFLIPTPFWLSCQYTLISRVSGKRKIECTWRNILPSVLISLVDKSSMLLSPQSDLCAHALNLGTPKSRTDLATLNFKSTLSWFSNIFLDSFSPHSCFCSVSMLELITFWRYYFFTPMFQNIPFILRFNYNTHCDISYSSDVCMMGSHLYSTKLVAEACVMSTVSCDVISIINPREISHRMKSEDLIK